MSTIYVTNEGSEPQKYDENRVHEIIHSGLFGPQALYWKEGMAGWRPLAELVAPPVQEAPLPPLPLPAPTPPEPSYQFMPKLRLQRLLAALIDFAALVVPFLITFAILSQLSPEPGVKRPHFAVFVTFGFYLLGLIRAQGVLVMMGRSLGKWCMGLYVANFVSRKRAGWLANIIRFVSNGFFGTVPLCLFTHLLNHLTVFAFVYALVDALLIFFHDRCIHDHVAGTTVLKRD